MLASLIGLLFGLIAIANPATPDYLPLPPPPVDELRQSGITLPGMITDELNLITGQDNWKKPRLKVTDDIINSTQNSDFWEIEILVEIIEADRTDDMTHYVRISSVTANKTESVLTNVQLSIIYNPQLEYYYDPGITFHMSRPNRTVYPLTAELPDNAIHRFKTVTSFPLPPGNPLELPPEQLRPKLDIFFRNMYVIAECDQGYEVIRVLPDDIRFNNPFASGNQ